jgi:hypothetical protein
MDFLFTSVFLGLSLAFWLIAVVAFLTLTAYADSERFGRAILLLVPFGIFLLYLAGATPQEAWQTVVADPMAILRIFGYYIALGITYGVLRWVWTIFKVRRKLIAFRSRNGIEGPLSQDQREGFMASIGRRYDSLPLRVSQNKARITFWMMFWPISLPLSLRPVTRLFEMVYEQIGGALQSMSNRAFRDLT